MKKDWLAAIIAFPAIIWEASVAFLKQVWVEESITLDGREYDQEQEFEETDSGDIV